MKQKGRRLRSILCSASFAVDDQEWPPRVLWPCAAEKCFYNFAYDALLQSASYVFSQEGAILLYDTTKKDCCTDVQQSFFDAFSAKTTDYSAAIAPVGQAPSQAPQSMQESAFTTAAPFSMVIAPTGQAPSQAPQPTHASETLCAIINSPFLSRADVIMKKRTLARPRTPPGICILVCILTKQAGKGKTNRAATTTK